MPFDEGVHRPAFVWILARWIVQAMSLEVADDPADLLLEHPRHDDVSKGVEERFMLWRECHCVTRRSGMESKHCNPSRNENEMVRRNLENSCAQCGSDSICEHTIDPPPCPRQPATAAVDSRRIPIAADLVAASKRAFIQPQHRCCQMQRNRPFCNRNRNRLRCPQRVRFAVTLDPRSPADVLRPRLRTRSQTDGQVAQCRMTRAIGQVEEHELSFVAPTAISIQRIVMRRAQWQRRQFAFDLVGERFDARP